MHAGAPFARPASAPPSLPVADGSSAPYLPGVLTTVNRRRGDDMLAPALALLRREGPAALTMRNVAQEAGVTATALYRHFASKDALVQALVREVYGEFRKALVAELPAGAPAAWLRVAAERYVRFALEHPHYYRLLFVEPHGFGIDRYPDDFVNGKSPTFRQLRDLVAACMREGVLAGDPSRDAPDVALTIYAHLHGLVMLYLAGRFPQRRGFERFAGESLDRLVKGIGAH